MKYKGDSIHIFKEKNLRRGAIFLSLTIFGMIYLGFYLLFVYILAFILNELICFFFGVDLIYNKDSVTRLFYSLPDCSDVKNDIWNKTEACFETEEMNPEEANDNRHKKIISLLGLKAGDRVLDLGCGEGVFVAYCQKMGIHAVGVTIVDSQAERAKKKGLNVRQGSYHDFFGEFENQFDAVTFIGSLEHACPNCLHTAAIRKMKTIYGKIFQNAKRYLDKKSRIGRIFTTTLHHNISFTKLFPAFIISRAYGGGYPADQDGMRIYDYIGGKIVYQADHTIDYYLATAKDPKHFGHTKTGTFISYLKGFLLAPLYPLVLYILIYDFAGLWMWQFDRKLHFKRDYVFVEDRRFRPVTLYWAVVEANNQESE